MDVRNCCAEIAEAVDGVGPMMLSQCDVRVLCIFQFDRRGHSSCLLASLSKVARPQDLVTEAWQAVRGPHRSNVIFSRLFGGMADLVGRGLRYRSAVYSGRSLPHSGLAVMLHARMQLPFGRGDIA
jgi:hypothetical protein